MVDSPRDELVEQINRIELRLTRVEHKVDSLDKRVDTLEQKVDLLDRKVDALDHKVDALDHKVDALDHKVDALAQSTDAGLREQREYTEFAFNRVRDGLQRLERKMDQFIDTQSRTNALVERRLTRLEGASP